VKQIALVQDNLSIEVTLDLYAKRFVYINNFSTYFFWFIIIYFIFFLSQRSRKYVKFSR